MGTEKRERQKAGRQARLEAAREAQRKAERNRQLRRTFGYVAAIAVVFGIVFVASRSGDDDEVATGNSSTTATTIAPTTSSLVGTAECPAADGSSPRTIDFDGPPPMCTSHDKDYSAVFSTSEGTIEVALDLHNAPIATNNFVFLARYHYYDDTTIFRTDPSIDIIQGGSPHDNSASDKGPGYNINDDGAGYTYEAGDLVMARSSGPNSAGAQFFFATGPKVANLNGQGTYVEFGHTTKGLDVLTKIIGLHKADNSGLGGGPSRTVTVTSVEIVEKPAAVTTTTTGGAPSTTGPPGTGSPTSGPPTSGAPTSGTTPVPALPTTTTRTSAP